MEEEIYEFEIQDLEPFDPSKKLNELNLECDEDLYSDILSEEDLENGIVEILDENEDAKIEEQLKKIDSVTSPLWDDDVSAEDLVAGLKKARVFNARIAVVDDNKFIREVLKKIVDRTGFKNVDYFKSGKEAMSSMIERKYKLLITDINLNKEMNGLDLLMNIRKSKSEDFDDLKIMIISAFSDNQDLNRLKYLNVKSFLPKPFEGKRFYHTVKGLLKTTQCYLEGKNC